MGGKTRQELDIEEDKDLKDTFFKSPAQDG